jgi:hypothetical protein
MNTEEKVKQMYYENTGTNFLDSGSIYGYGYEKTEKYGIPQELYILDKDANLEDCEIGYDVMVNLYYLMVEYLTYAEKLTNELHEFAEQFQDYYWTDIIDDWCEENGFKINYHDNTYNFDEVLSKVFQFWDIGNGDEEFIIIQLHNGCDVRGGYTKPAIFFGCISDILPCREMIEEDLDEIFDNKELYIWSED